MTTSKSVPVTATPLSISVLMVEELSALWEKASAYFNKSFIARVQKETSSLYTAGDIQITAKTIEDGEITLRDIKIISHTHGLLVNMKVHEATDEIQVCDGIPDKLHAVGLVFFSRASPRCKLETLRKVADIPRSLGPVDTQTP